MGSYGGPNISRDGLVLYLDASNVKSFRGEPTTNHLSDGISGMNVVMGNNWLGYVPSTVGNSEFGTPIKRYITSGTHYMYSRDEVLDDDLVTLSEKTVTFSLYIKRLEGAATGRIRIYDNVSGYSFYTVNVTTEFQRFSGTKTLSANPTRIFVMIDNTGGGTYDIHSPQLEQKSYSTPFVDGTRGSTVETGGGWADMTKKGNHGELVNSPTFDDISKGSLVFDGVDDYISVNYNSNTMDFSEAQTICMWLKPGTGSNSIRRNPYNQAYGGSGTLTHETSGAINYYFGTHGGNSTPYVARSSGFNVNANELTFITVTRSQSLALCKWYKNGSLITSNTAGGYSAVTNSTNNILIADGYTNNFIGDIYLTAVYNSFFTEEDVLQFYNATKSRFGL